MGVGYYLSSYILIYHSNINKFNWTCSYILINSINILHILILINSTGCFFIMRSVLPPPEYPPSPLEYGP